MADPYYNTAPGGFDPNDYAITSGPDAAISVAVMIAVAATILTVMRRSGFRAMVAVGRS